jgi:gluconate 5-dehydrogenase
MSVKELFKLDGRVALITGGSRGLGLQMAEALGEMGCKLAITARKADELTEAKAHLQTMGFEVLTVVNDLSRTDQIPSLVDQVLQHYGTIDILVRMPAPPGAHRRKSTRTKHGTRCSTSTSIPSSFFRVK